MDTASDRDVCVDVVGEEGEPGGSGVKDGRAPDVWRRPLVTCGRSQIPRLFCALMKYFK